MKQQLTQREARQTHGVTDRIDGDLPRGVSKPNSLHLCSKEQKTTRKSQKCNKKNI